MPNSCWKTKVILPTGKVLLKVLSNEIEAYIQYFPQISVVNTKFLSMLENKIDEDTILTWTFI
jgi:hypothetical protein